MKNPKIFIILYIRIETEKPPSKKSTAETMTA